MASPALVLRQPTTWLPDSLVFPFKLLNEDDQTTWWTAYLSRRLLSGFLAGYLSGPGALAVVLALVSGVFLGCFVLAVLEVACVDGKGQGECLAGCAVTEG